MRLGIDFDNTLVTYDRLFHRIAQESGLIPASTPVNKTAVRDHLRRAGREETWTEMQGTAYGPRMGEADLFPGVLPALDALRNGGFDLFIISHKTRYPFLGARHDLHRAALDWLEKSGLLKEDRLRREAVFFEPTKEKKLLRVQDCGCTHFIDDLPEILAHAAFPPGVEKFLFDPGAQILLPPLVTRITAWSQVPARLLAPRS